MYDVSASGATDAISNYSDWLSSASQVRVPMPAARKPTGKQPPLGTQLARKRSQDGADKIRGWNAAGGGVMDDETVAVEPEREVHDVETPAGDDAVVAIEEANEGKESSKGVSEGALAKPQDETPTKPKSPASAQKSGQKSGGKPAREIDAERKAWVRRRSKPQIEEENEVKHGVGAPKKRVVSDGHWRKDRSPSKDKALTAATPEKEKETTPKPVTVRRSVVNVGLRVPPSMQTFEEDKPARPRHPRHSYSRSKSRDDAEVREGDPDYQSNGTKVYVKRRRRSKPLDDLASEVKDVKSSSASSFTATASSLEKSSESTDITSPSEKPAKETPPRPSTAERRETLKYSTERDEVQRERRRARRRKSTLLEKEENAGFKIPKASDLSPQDAKDSQRYAKQSPSPMPGPTGGTRIGNWLANMPDDPFTEAKDEDLRPEPLRTSRKKIDKHVEKNSETVQNDEPEHRKDTGRRRRSRPSLEPISTEQSSRQTSAKKSPRDSAETLTDVSTPEPAPLRRSGAKRDLHSPSGRRRRHGSPSIDGSAITEEVSSVGDSTLEQKESRRRHHGDSSNSHRSRDQLSTVSSVETLSKPGRRNHRTASGASENLTIVPEGSEVSRASDGDEPHRKPYAAKRRTAKHSDLISVLSMEPSDPKKIVSARSIRTNRAPLGTASIGDLMNELTTDELKYQRELRTLVDGVIPVLLTNVLSSSNKSLRSINSTTSNSKDDPAVTKPIVDMGIALERLKTAHKRIPMHEPADLLCWAQNTSRVYSDYLRAWRLGFEEVVVNLAPGEDDAQGSPRQAAAPGAHGERVDVAYLLKRPLVRLKYLAKTFKGISQVRPSASAEDVAAKYQDLVEAARERSNSERARLEDEAAASIDPTRARDPKTLVPLTGVRLDPTRCVRARDYFDMYLQHSSGQQLDCKIEIVLRDDSPGRGESGDVLFCEVSNEGRWLLFPPTPQHLVSARQGSNERELVVMVRGFLGGGQQWEELMSLQSSDEEAGFEWVQMLGTEPIPPSLSRQPTFKTIEKPSSPSVLSAENLAKARPPSPSEVDVPIGERATTGSMMWDDDCTSVANDPISPGGLRRAKATRRRQQPVSPLSRSSMDTAREEPKERGYFMSGAIPQRDSVSETRESMQKPGRPKTTYDMRSNTDWTTSSSLSTPTKKDYSVWMPSQSSIVSDESSEASDEEEPPHRQQRPGMHRRTSSVPSLEMPTIPRQRKSSQQHTPEPPRHHHRAESAPSTPVFPPPNSAPAKLRKRKPTPPKEPTKGEAPANGGKTTGLGLRSNILPSFTPAFLKKSRRPSSPLKHEYAPSTDSETLSSSESELSDLDDGDRSITSESSTERDEREGRDEIDDQISTVGELKDFSNGFILPRRELPKRFPQQSSPPESVFSPSDPSLKPSESASQAPYRSVPQTGGRASETVAGIFSWSDRGSWDPLHPQDCSIYVTPGLIEAFDMHQAHDAPPKAHEASDSSPSTRGVRPLVAFELTPLVPLRRGTALDISIRSPPTSNSVIRVGANVMFRSRNPEECEALYALINRARINNPTYIALQNARGPQSNWAESMDRRNANRSSSGSWWQLGSRKSSTYRSKSGRQSARSASIAATDSSVGTMNSAFSALRRFSNNSRIFNIARSTVNTLDGSGTRGSAGSDSLESGQSSPLPLDPRLGTPLGITNAKTRLYIRETASKWRDLGSARLSILIPPRPDPSVPANPATTGLKKRVLISGKTKGETLLDATLGETSFERVARTGIAVSVWEEGAAVGATGGVNPSGAKVYMVQMKSVSSPSDPLCAMLCCRWIRGVLGDLDADFAFFSRNAIALTLSAWWASFGTEMTALTAHCFFADSFLCTLWSWERFLCLDDTPLLRFAC